jgi:SOS-response transcriptional repressor LexA
MPENPEMEPMIYRADRVTIHGVLVGQMRSYR